MNLSEASKVHARRRRAVYDAARRLAEAEYDKGRKRASLTPDARKRKAEYDKGRRRDGKHITLIDRPILAIDGEGVTDGNGNHRYIMLAASNGTHVDAHMLTTRQCFDFLLSLPQRHLVVGFSINYDVAMWLRWVPRDSLEYLWKRGRMRWNEYSVQWAPGKYFNLKHDDGRKVRIYDVFGFFQHSFVSALQEWKVGTTEEVSRIAEMKASRAQFSDESAEQMLAYCLEECRLLVEMMGKLRDALIEGGIPIEQWYGAGAIAAAIMKKEGVKKYLERLPPEKYSIPIMSAYFGGRFELYRSGEHMGVYTYDIRSAYPHIMRSLPCLTHATYRESKGFIESEWGLYEVEWNVSKSAPWPPFPFRLRDRRIIYPYSGKGWYHASEVRAAVRAFGSAITIRSSIIIDLHCPDGLCQPFGFIPAYFKFRSLLKERGSQAQLTIKLGLNSLYGKTAQGVGFIGPDNEARKPPFQSYLWAGMITAGTRAMLLDAIRQAPEDILWTATDGLVSRVPLWLECGEELGKWESSYADVVFSVQSGVYLICRGGDMEIRSRGFGKAESNFYGIRAAYYRDRVGGSFTYEARRFVGLGGALSRRDFWKHFGKWVEVTRTLNFEQHKRFTVEDSGGIRHLPPGPPVDQDGSMEFVARTSWTDQWERESDDESLVLLLDGEQP
jgi:hypothetical protein